MLASVLLKEPFAFGVPLFAVDHDEMDIVRALPRGYAIERRGRFSKKDRAVSIRILPQQAIPRTEWAIERPRLGRVGADHPHRGAGAPA